MSFSGASRPAGPRPCDGLIHSARDLTSGSPAQELVAAKLPRLHHHLQSIGCDMTIIGATDWILCLYTTSLPAEVSPSSHSLGAVACKGGCLPMGAASGVL